MSVPLDEYFEAFGIPATVTPPGSDAIEATGFWVSPLTEDMPAGLDLTRRELRRVLALRRSEVPSVPRGTYIDAADIGSDTATRWRVDGFERVEADHLRVIVVSDPEAVIPEPWIESGWFEA